MGVDLVGEELGVMLSEGASEFATTVTEGFATGSFDERDTPRAIVNATTIKTAPSRSFLLRHGTVGCK